MDAQNLTVKEVGEFELHRMLREILTEHLSADLYHLQDDAAVLKRELFAEYILTSVDSMVEGVHFLPQAAAHAVGWKLLARSLSDIAAMGGSPGYAVIALQLPETTSVAWVKELYRGICELATKFKLALVGGDVTYSPTLALSLTILGSTKSKPIARSGAKVGDDIWVSGKIGAAALGLQILQGRIQLEGAKHDEFIEAYQMPMPQVLLGQRLLDIANSAIDVSDGLLQDLQHIAELSEVECLVDYALIPFADEKYQLEQLAGGDDYQLLFTLPGKYRLKLESLSEEGFNMSRIGKVQSGLAGIKVLTPEGELRKGSLGYTHFIGNN